MTEFDFFILKYSIKWLTTIGKVKPKPKTKSENKDKEIEVDKMWDWEKFYGFTPKLWADIKKEIFKHTINQCLGQSHDPTGGKKWTTQRH